MSPGPRVWGACRAIAIRSRPVASRAQPLYCSIPRTRWYSDDAKNQPPKPVGGSSVESSEDFSASKAAAKDIPSIEAVKAARVCDARD